jgi:O-methyltransferase involved in polyketide biosynthesis
MRGEVAVGLDQDVAGAKLQSAGRRHEGGDGHQRQRESHSPHPNEDNRPMAEPRPSISPTAYYTAAVWARHGLSHPTLSTARGRLMYRSAQPAMAITEALGGTRLEDFLLTRHLLIDSLLDESIERGEVSQVIELAAGLSPRGWRFAERYGERLTYIETDLPGMAERKRVALERAGSLGPSHRVLALDALRHEDEASLAGLAAELDPSRGLAIVTEGLLSYLDRDSVLGLWRRAAESLRRFPHGLMLSDLHLGGENTGLITAIGVRVLSAFVRGSVEMHFEHEADAAAALTNAGFAAATLHSGTEISDARGAGSVRVIEATVRGEGGRS